MAFPVGSLRVDLGANTVAFQSGMAAAQERLAEFQRAGAQAGNAAQAFGRQVASASTGFGSITGQVQNAAFQIGDFAVQVAGGTSATRALAQQLPQLLGGFGVMGAVIGAAVAVAAPFVGRLFETEDAAAAATARIDALSDATKGYVDAAELAVSPIEDLVAKYGELADSVRAVQIAQAELARGEAMRALQSSLESVQPTGLEGFSASVIRGVEAAEMRVQQMYQRISDMQAILTPEQARFFDFTEDFAEIDRLRGQIEAVRAGIDEFADAYGITNDQAQLLAAAMAEVEASATGTAAQQIEAVEQLRTALEETYGSLDAANQVMPELVSLLNSAALSTAEIAAADMASPIDNASGAAGGLAENMERAATAAQLFYAAQVTRTGLGPSPVGMVPEDLLPPGQMQGPPVAPGFTPPAAPRGGVGRSGADRARIDAEREAMRVYAETRTALEQYNEELERLNELKLQESDIITDEVYARAVDQLNEKYLEASRASEELRRAQEGIADAFADAIVEGRNFGEAISAVLKDLASQLIRTALVGGGKGGGTGLFGFLFEGLDGLFGGARANGGPVTGGRAYLVGERGPELFVPPTSGSMLNAPATDRALAGGGGVNVHLTVNAPGAVEGVEKLVQRELMRAVPELEQRTLNAVRAASARGKL
jgi:hypothetical protein